MRKSITYSGEAEINSPQEIAEGKVVIDNLQIELDLSFYDGRPEYDWVAEYKDYIRDLEQHKANVEAAIRSDYKDGGDVKEYVDFHLEELSVSIIDKVLADTDASKPREERLLTTLKLVRVGFYPGDEDCTIWDYTIGGEVADMLVVVSTDNTGKINYVTWENWKAIKSFEKEISP